MKAAVVYYSQSGNTRQTAEKIAVLLGAELVRIEPEKPYPNKGFAKYFWGGKSAVFKETPPLAQHNFAAENYDIVVLGTPVWAGRFSPPLRSFVAQNKAIREKPLAVFVCYSGGGAEKAIAKLAKFIGIEKFTASLSLIDPRAKPSTENDEKIKSFCERLSQCGK